LCSGHSRADCRDMLFHEGGLFRQGHVGDGQSYFVSFSLGHRPLAWDQHPHHRPRQLLSVSLCHCISLSAYLVTQSVLPRPLRHRPRPPGLFCATTVNFPPPSAIAQTMVNNLDEASQISSFPAEFTTTQLCTRFPLSLSFDSDQIKRGIWRDQSHAVFRLSQEKGGPWCGPSRLCANTFLVEMASRPGPSPLSDRQIQSAVSRLVNFYLRNRKKISRGGWLILLVSLGNRVRVAVNDQRKPRPQPSQTSQRRKAEVHQTVGCGVNECRLVRRFLRGCGSCCGL
jgi:hypothetical protein